jgi:hypothetical protein
MKKLQNYIETLTSQDFENLVIKYFYGDLNTQAGLLLLIEENPKFIKDLKPEEFIFSSKLIEDQKVTDEAVKEIGLLNVLKNLVNHSMNAYDEKLPEERKVIIELGAYIAPMENIAQKLWNFEVDKTNHTWWYQLDKRECLVHETI